MILGTPELITISRHDPFDLERQAAQHGMAPEEFVRFAKTYNQAVNDVELARERRQTLDEYFAGLRGCE